MAHRESAIWFPITIALHSTYTVPGGGLNTPQRTRAGAGGHIGRGGAPRSGPPMRSLPGEGTRSVNDLSPLFIASIDSDDV